VCLLHSTRRFGQYSCLLHNRSRVGCVCYTVREGLVNTHVCYTIGVGLGASVTQYEKVLSILMSVTRLLHNRSRVGCVCYTVREGLVNTHVCYTIGVRLGVSVTQNEKGWSILTSHVCYTVRVGLGAAHEPTLYGVHSI